MAAPPGCRAALTTTPRCFRSPARQPSPASHVLATQSLKGQEPWHRGSCAAWQRRQRHTDPSAGSTARSAPGGGSTPGAGAAAGAATRPPPCESAHGPQTPLLRLAPLLSPCRCPSPRMLGPEFRRRRQPLQQPWQPQASGARAPPVPCPHTPAMEGSRQWRVEVAGSLALGGRCPLHPASCQAQRVCMSYAQRVFHLVLPPVEVALNGAHLQAGEVMVLQKRSGMGVRVRVVGRWPLRTIEAGRSQTVLTGQLIDRARRWRALYRPTRRVCSMATPVAEGPARAPRLPWRSSTAGRPGMA